MTLETAEGIRLIINEIGNLLVPVMICCIVGTFLWRITS